MVLFESESEQYSWLNTKVCMLEGAINPDALTSHFEVYVCENDLI